ncbi:hypothetical protein D3C71_1293140 [compost metagenome]
MVEKYRRQRLMILPLRHGMDDRNISCSLVINFNHSFSLCIAIAFIMANLH